MKKLRNVMIMFLMFAFLFTSTVSAYANSEVNTLTAFATLEHNITVLESKAQYEKLELVDKTTGEVQIVETFLGDNARVVITNPENNNELVVTVSDNQIRMVENDVLVHQLELDANEIIPLDWTGWTGWSYWNTSKRTDYSTALLYASAVALLLGTVVSAVVLVANIAFHFSIKEVWWKKGRNQRYDFSQSVVENHEKVWAYSESVMIQAYQIGDVTERYFYTPID